MDIEQASLFVAMMRSPAGKMFLEKVQKDYATAVSQLLYASVEDLPVMQGKARGVYEMLRLFEQAQQVVDNGS